MNELCTDLLKMDGFDDCIVGICERYGMDTVLAYDREKVLAKLMSRDGMTEEEANEFFEFNQIGAWMGELTPVFVTLFNQPKETLPCPETSKPNKK
ncbi:hypothetical protein EBR66_08395 [bacterium]|nr:hypothetical protein [bacterium]